MNTQNSKVKITKETEDGITIIRITGELFLENNQQLMKLFEGLEDIECNMVILNLADLKWLDSSSLGMLVGLQKKVTSGSGRMIVTNVNPLIEKIMRFTQLVSVLEIMDDEKEAIAALKKSLIGG